MKPKAIVLIAMGLIVLVGVGWFVVGRFASPPTIVVATYNADGLLQSNDQDTLEAIASALRSADADVLAIQGVESERSVRDFADTYLAGLGYDHIASRDVGHDDGTENAVLSRYPIRDTKVFPREPIPGEHPRRANGRTNPFFGDPMRFSQSPLFVEIDIPRAQPLFLLNMDHKGGNRFEYWRQIEAEGIVALARKHARRSAVLIVGSFHAEDDAPMFEVYDDAGFRDPLEDAADELATETSGDRIDFILCRKDMLDGFDPASAQVFELSIPSGDDVHYPLAVRYKPRK